MSRYGVHDSSRLPVDDSGLTLNGRPLSDWHLWLLSDGVSLAAPEQVTSLAETPGAQGAADMTLRDEAGYPYYRRRDLTMSWCTTGDEPEYWETRARLAMLDGTEVTVGWPCWPGVARGLLTVGDWTTTLAHGGAFEKAVCEPVFSCDPCLYGPRMYFEAGTAAVVAYVEGNRPSHPTISIVPPEGTRRIYLTVNDRQLVYNLDADGRTTLTVDCAARSSVYGAAPIWPSVDSDYPVLLPGANRASVSAGVMRIEYVPMIMV